MQGSIAAPRRGLPLVAVAVVGLIVLVGIVLAIAPGLRPAAPTSSAATDEQNLALVRAYFQTFNAGMKSGDFSGLATVMAPDAVETISNPQGQTSVHRGIADITAFYQSFQKGLPGAQWTTDDLRVLGPNAVIAYEHAASPPLSVPGRCVHVFTVQNGKIATYDWTTYFPGQK